MPIQLVSKELQTLHVHTLQWIHGKTTTIYNVYRVVYMVVYWYNNSVFVCIHLGVIQAFNNDSLLSFNICFSSDPVLTSQVQLWKVKAYFIHPFQYSMFMSDFKRVIDVVPFWISPTAEFSKRVRMISDQLFITLYVLSIYLSAHKMLRERILKTIKQLNNYTILFRPI